MKEASNNGYIALYRSLLDWEWYNDIPTRCLFIHLLLTVNYADAKMRGRTIKRGQRLTSIQELSNETRLTFRQTRTALDHLKLTNEVTSVSSSQGTVITVKNYTMYQKAANEKAINRQTTDKPGGKRPANDRQTTSNKNNNIPPISPKGDEYSPAFLEFWAVYPKKVGKGAAWRSFQKAKPGRDLLGLILKAVQEQRRTPSWTKDGGQYIPNPATWLNQRRWEDEVGPTQEEQDEYK